MTQETNPTNQTPQPELSAEQAAAKGMEDIKALGQTALPHIVAVPVANFREAPAATENIITGIPEEIKNQNQQ